MSAPAAAAAGACGAAGAAATAGGAGAARGGAGTGTGGVTTGRATTGRAGTGATGTGGAGAGGATGGGATTGGTGAGGTTAGGAGGAITGAEIGATSKPISSAGPSAGASSIPNIGSGEGITTASRCFSSMRRASRESTSRRPGSIFWTFLRTDTAFAANPSVAYWSASGQQQRHRLLPLVGEKEHVGELHAQARVRAAPLQLRLQDLDGAGELLRGDERDDVLFLRLP